MILKPEELALLKRGRRTFTTDTANVNVGDVIRLRSSRKDPGFLITVRRLEPRGEAFKVWFTVGDSREEQRFIAAGWPDYTTDPFRAMRGEPPPFSESAVERNERGQWLYLALKSEARPAVVSSTTSLRVERTVFAAGSPEAVRVVRLWLKATNKGCGT